MFERFTERARQVVVLGQDEARAQTAAGWEPPDEWATATRGEGESLMGTRLEVMTGLALAAVSFPLGLLVGWLIWG